MCLIVFALDFHKDYPLILAANRDEFYNRKSMKATFWEDAPGVLAGRDLKAGGTWLGVHESGKMAAITNYRDPKIEKEKAPTRGLLPLNYLRSELGPLGYLKKLQNDNGYEYNGFNLLTANLNSMYHYNNIDNKINKVDSGIHAVSNAFFNTPWPKAALVKQKLRHEIDKGFDAVSLLDMLYDTRKASDRELPSTGISLKWERDLSSIFINTNGYGTRSSTVVLFHKSKHVVFAERIYSPVSRIFKENITEFDIKSA